MVTKAPPPRIIGLFAENAPVCVVLRRGPSRYSQQILWRTDNDEFTPGQWIRGNVDYATLTSDGRYMALGVMGAKSRIGSWEDTQISLICRPPYFTALELWIGGLCFNTVAFLPDDVLAHPTDLQHVVNASNECPLQRVTTLSVWPISRDHDYTLNASVREATGHDQQGREVRLEAGKVFAKEGNEWKLLFDAALHQFEHIEAPGWAREW